MTSAPGLGRGNEVMAKKEKRDVLVSYDFLPIFKELLNTNRAQAAAELTVAIIEFDKDGIEPSFSDDNVSFTWKTMIKPLLEKNKQRYKKTCEERTKAINNRYQKDSIQENTKATNEYKCSNSIQENTKATDIDIDIDVDVDNDVDGDKEKDYVEKESGGGGFSADALELAKLWEQRFGLVSSYRMQNLADLADEYGKEIAEYAIKEAHQAVNSNWNYIKAIARNEHMRRQQEIKTGYAMPRGRPSGNPKNDAQAGRSEALSILKLDGGGSG